jgi:ubiquinone/menaquinone biosynthesis C-methylase UbiE/uncharacterized protein YbaR (Trm112 family)
MPQLRDYQVRCPTCKNGLLAQPEQAAAAACETCGAAFALREGFLDLLPDWHERRTFAQVLMEWPPLIRIYESRLWRRSAVAARGMRIDFERELALITDAAGLAPDQRVLDLACGPGIYARPFAAAVHPGPIVGLDLSAPMLRFAAEKAREEGISNLLLVRGNAMALPFEPDHFDVVNCCGALHLFPDAGEALTEVVRVLRPGGRFTVAAFRRPEGALAERLVRFRRRVGGFDAYTQAGLTAALSKAGLAAPQCHHAAGNWLILSATKP